MNDQYGPSRWRRRFTWDEQKNVAKHTDWQRLRSMTDEDIDLSDIPALTEEFFARAQVRGPSSLEVTIPVDAGVLAWYQSQGDEWQDHIRAAMREYANAHIDDDLER
jgi:uncharacterized protein (DUF4415 family)